MNELDGRSEIDILREEIRLLRLKVETLETQARERDIEERSAFLQIVASIERRHGLEPRRSRKPLEVYISDP